MREVVFYSLVFILLTLGLSSAITTLITNTYYSFNMYFQPGLYRFTPSGQYYYYPSGPYATLSIDGGGVIEVNGSVYVNSTTVQPGFYEVIIVPAKNDIGLYYAVSFLFSVALSLMIVALLHRLLLWLANR
ncbi:MAG: hypothetical protein JHC26_00500 [Thermofilum sp.]|uniref:hypothetical protein n=1 Tax=Thermofilum sp. TaxID=1961369 RepID=UPI00258D2C8A|nr:hypothetical protein [Thermofilum sp.]MCI4407545.1 hypothetical protein [Thermofilum sp.]